MRSSGAQPEIATEADSDESVNQVATDASTEPLESIGDDPAPAAPAAQPATSNEPAETVTGSPQMGTITFAPETTSAGEPVEPTFSFEAGITQVHAVFD
jgi:hypothetical protein